MTRWIAISLAVVTCFSLRANAVAQQLSAVRSLPANDQPEMIVAGQRLADVAAILRKHGYELNAGFEGGFHGAGAEDKRMIGSVLDDEHTTVAVVYSARTEQVLGLSVVLKQSRQTVKPDQIWMSVRSLTLFSDGSYSLHFEKPDPPKPIAKPAGERPSFGPTPTGTFGGKSKY